MSSKIEVKNRSRTLDTNCYSFSHSLVYTPNRKQTLNHQERHFKKLGFCNQPTQVPCQKNPKNKLHESKKGICEFMRITNMKAEIQKLTYREKINNIEALVWRCKELSQEFGYFGFTSTMLQYHEDSPIKFSLWVHPDRRTNRVLHPIIKPNQFERELQFVVNVKMILRDLFPTIDLGKGKTLANLIFHITNLKKVIIMNGKKSFGPLLSFEDGGCHEHTSQDSSTIIEQHQRPLYTSLKTVPRVHEVNFPVEEADDDIEPSYAQKMSNFKKKNGQKATAESLLESIRSNKSLKQKIIKATMNVPEKQPTGPNTHAKISIQNNSIEKLKEKQIKEEKERVNNFGTDPAQVRKSKLQTKRSRIKNPMATSGEIQNDFNNLFGSDDFCNNGYYEGQRESRPSVLSQVMEEFQQLLF